MPPAFALSQDQTLRFIQASPCNQSHTATPKRTPKAQHSHQLLLSQSQTTKHQATTPRTHTPKRAHTQAPTAHPTPPLIATRQKHTAKPAQHPAIQRQPSTINFQKNQMQLSNNKKEPATECHKAPHIAGPLNSTNHRQGKNTSQ